MREIITLQLGNLSNYVATHYWNAQESYFTYGTEAKSVVDHNIHWRAGIGADGSETFLPRTVIYDLKGGFGSLRKTNVLYETVEEHGLDSPVWTGPYSQHEQTALEKSAYQTSLDAGLEPHPPTNTSVRYWSDYSRVYYHPKSLVQLYDYELSSTTMPFERFDAGMELLNSLDKEEDIVDRDWRPFAEECDQMQGIQILTTIDDAWGGFAASYAEALRDEYPKTCIWTWGLRSPLLNSPREKRRLRASNVIQSLSQLYASSSMLLPIAVPRGSLPRGIELDQSSSWQVSALLSTGIETASLPTRLIPKANSFQVSLDELTNQLNAAGKQRLCGVSMELDVGDSASKDIDLSQISNDKVLSEPSKRRVFGEVAVVRNERGDSKDEAGRDDGPAPMFDPVVGSPISNRHNIALDFPLTNSFPRIYTTRPTANKLPMRTLSYTDSTISVQLKSLRSQLRWLPEVADRERITSELADIEDAYRNDWSSDSDEGDDDI